MNGNEENFEIKQILEQSNDEYYNIDFQNTTFIDIHTMKKGRFETNIRAFLIKNQSSYQVRYPNIENIYYQTNYQINFVRVLSEDTILLVNDTKYWIANTQNYRNINSTVLDVQVQDNFIILLTKLEILFSFYDTQFMDVNITIDQQLLHKFLPKVTQPFQIISVQFALYDELVLLDKKLGIIILKIMDIKTLELNFLYDYPNEDNYHSMAISFDESSYQIVVTLSYGEVMTLEKKSVNAYYLQYNVSSLKLSVINSSKIQKFFILHNSTFLMIFNINRSLQYLYSKTFTQPMMLTVDYYFSTIYIVSKTEQIKYFVSNGLFIMNPVITRDQNLQTLQIIGSEESQCAITLNYIVYDYLDNNLYKKQIIDDQIFPFVNYPTYPQISIFKELGVTGSNIKAQIELNDENIQLNIGYQEDMIISGIIWPENIEYVNMFFAQQFVYYLVQSQTLKATLYQCKIQPMQFELLCQKIHDFNPNKKLDSDSFQWTQYNEVVIFGYISKFRHTIELFQLKSSLINPLFTISTSLKDENSTITSFTLTKQYVFVVLESKQQILIYSLQTQIQLLIIVSSDVLPYTFKPKSIKFDSEQQLIIILNEESLIIGFIYERFIFLDYLSFPNCRQLTVSIASNTFFVALHYGHLQELREYSTRRRQITILKKIPLFHYVLQEPLQMISQGDLIIIRAYTPVLQQTVLLIYQADKALRECLLTHVPLGIYLKDNLNLGITSYTYSGLLIHISSKYGMKNLFIYEKFQAKITSKWNSQYIHKKELLIKYESIDSPEKIEFIENVTFLNLMTNIVTTVPQKKLEVNERIVKIENDWFKGFIVDYKIDCEQCDDQILLTQKIDLISSLDYYQVLSSECKMKDDFYVILGNQSLIFLDNSHFVKYPTFYFTLPYMQPVKVWCNNDTILITGQTNTSEHFIQMIKFFNDTKEFRIVGKPFTILISNELLQLEILDDSNFIYLDGNQYTGGYYFNTAKLCPIHYEFKEPSQVEYLKFGCVDYRKHTEFFVSSFIVYKINNKFRVILSDLSQGLFIQEFQYTDNIFRYVTFTDTILRISLIQPLKQMLGINIDDQVRFLKVLKFGEPINNYQQFKIILLTNSIAHFQIVLEFDDDVYQTLHIVQTIQRYSTFTISFQASIEGNYLALLYYYPNYKIIIYKLDSLENEIVLPLGGIEIPFQSNGFFFSLHFDQNHQLLLQMNPTLRKMSLYYIDEYAQLTFLDGAIEQPIVLTAQNSLTSANMILNVELNIQGTSNFYWIFLFILIGVIFFLLCLGLIVYKNQQNEGKIMGTKNRKKEQKLII